MRYGLPRCYLDKQFDQSVTDSFEAQCYNKLIRLICAVTIRSSDLKLCYLVFTRLLLLESADIGGLRCLDG